MKNGNKTIALYSVSTLLLCTAGACTTHEGDTIYYQAGGAGNNGRDGRDGRDAMGGGSGKDGQDGRDGRPGQDGRPGKDGTDAPGTGGDGGLPDAYPSNLPACESVVPLEELGIDLFGIDGHSFYFEVTPGMRRAQDDRYCDYGGGNGAVYQLGENEDICPPSAFNVRVVPSGSSTCADTGKVELGLPGQSSWRAWNEIPNFKLDVGEFEDQKFTTGDKTVRMNNGQADSTIVREATALAIWRAMGYPAPKTRFVKTQSNVWDYDYEPGVFAAHNMVQPYKKAFFSQNLSEVTSAWEGEGDPFSGWSNMECEWSKGAKCQDSALREIVDSVNAAPQGEGFMEATAAVIDWPMLHKNQCLSALTGTGDDWIHNSNNVVIALRQDGKIIYLPYSTDISGGHPWYPNTPYDPYSYGYGVVVEQQVMASGGYEEIFVGSPIRGAQVEELIDVGMDGPYYGYGQNLAVRCAQDSACRAQALDACDEMIDEFESLNVVESIVEERCDALADAGLERRADGDVCDALADFYESRPSELRGELESLRAGGGHGEGGASGTTGDLEE